jgi:hypothetical protein
MFRLMSLLGACALVGACATNHSTVAASAATAPPAAAAPGDATAAAPKVNRIYLEDKTLTNDEVKALFEQGYKPTSRNGEVYYCRREAQLGTRFEHMTCRTADQMKEIAREAKDLAAEKQRPSGCTSQGASC